MNTILKIFVLLIAVKYGLRLLGGGLELFDPATGEKEFFYYRGWIIK